MDKESDTGEWHKPENWRAGLLYVAPRDPRIVVPKRNPRMGLTINLGHRVSRVWLTLLLLPPLLILIAGVWTGRRH